MKDFVILKIAKLFLLIFTDMLHLSLRSAYPIEVIYLYKNQNTSMSTIQLQLWSRNHKRGQLGHFRLNHVQALLSKVRQNKIQSSLHDALIEVVGDGYLVTLTDSCIIRHQSVILFQNIKKFIIGIYSPFPKMQTFYIPQTLDHNRLRYPLKE